MTQNTLSTQAKSPQIWLVPTPVGNLKDMTLRALEVLKEADAVACEDTRRTGLLLKHFEIHKPLLRLDAHTMQRAPALLEQYPRLAYVSDAGTPGISDPGAELVQLALQQDIEVEVLAGPTAFVPALILSGLPSARFCFEGFLPRKGQERQERLMALSARPETTVFYESPHRLHATLQELIGFCGPERQVSVTRELSKRFEETRRGTLAFVAASFAEEVRGEICVVLCGQSEAEALAAQEGQEDLEALAQSWHAQGQSLRDIRAGLMARGMKKNEAYALALRLEHTTA